MFKAIKNNKIIAISEKKEFIYHTDEGDVIHEITGEELFPCLVFDEVIEDTEHTVDEYEHYQGEFLLKSDIPAPTKEEVSETRKQLYTDLVDPLTAQISRLKDEPQTDKLIAEIEALKVERSELVAKIKEENPYPVEPTEPSETATSEVLDDSENTGLSWKNE